MFKKPRKTCHSDARQSYESVHDDIMQRLTDEERASYLCDVMPLLEKIGTDVSASEARKIFYKSATSWMTQQERDSFCDVLQTDQSAEAHPNFCKQCEAVSPMTIHEQQGHMTCDVCGVCIDFVGPSSDRYLPWDHCPASAPCPYRRSNHFNEFLDSFMARQASPLLPEIFDKIHKELKKQRVTDFSTLTQKRIRSIMKDLRLNKHYESAPFILYHIKGERPPVLTPVIEQELKSNFDLIQEPFERVVKVVAPERKNFLSYGYTIYKMLQLMEQDHLLEYFTLLKSREKLLIQDKIWKGICEAVGWDFIPSL